MADDSVVVGFKWKGKPSNQSLPPEEVRCKNMQNAGLRVMIGESELYIRARTTHLESEGPAHPSDIRISLLVDCASVN